MIDGEISPLDPLFVDEHGPLRLRIGREKFTIERWGMAYRIDVRQQSYPGPCTSHLVESCIHSAFYGTIWTVVFNDSKVFTQLGNMPSERVMSFIGKTPATKFGVSCVLNTIPIFIIFGITKTVACSVEKVRRRTDKLNDFLGGFVSGCTVGLLELNSVKHKQEIFRNGRQAMKGVLGYGIFVGGIYSMLLTPRIPESGT